MAIPLGVLIETYWNVKLSIASVCPLSAPVLIETYWNVKTHCPQGIKNVSSINRNILECKVGTSDLPMWVKFLVLIETYWNVKFFERDYPKQFAESINRNILECKDDIILNIYRIRLRINRNILECKDYYGNERRRLCLSINRNILECKGESSQVISR